MSRTDPGDYVSRGGDKLAGALDHFRIDVTELVCADLGSHVGGFVDCLLRRGVARVFAVDTAYGTFAWKLRREPRVVVLERTNAMHVTLPEPVDLVTIDVGWTRQSKILKSSARLVARPCGPGQPGSPSPAAQNTSRTCATGGSPASARLDPGADPTMPHVAARILTLIKPHYEAAREQLVDGVLPDDLTDGVVSQVLEEAERDGWTIHGTCESSIRGRAGNREVFALLSRR